MIHLLLFWACVFFFCLVPALILCPPPVPPSRSSCLSCVLCFCFYPHRSFSFFFSSQINLLHSWCVCFTLVFLFVCEVWLDKTSTFSEIHKWDIRSTRPWRSLNTDYLCTKWTFFWVPREPALLPSLWQGLHSVHAQLPLLWEGSGSAAETGQGSTGKYICNGRYRYLTLTALTCWCCKVAVSQLDVSSLSLDLGNVIIHHKDLADARRDDSQHFQNYHQSEVSWFLGMG